MPKKVNETKNLKITVHKTLAKKFLKNLQEFEKNEKSPVFYHAKSDSIIVTNKIVLARYDANLGAKENFIIPISYLPARKGQVVELTYENGKLCSEDGQIKPEETNLKLDIVLNSKVLEHKNISKFNELIMFSENIKYISELEMEATYKVCLTETANEQNLVKLQGKRMDVYTLINNKSNE